MKTVVLPQRRIEPSLSAKLGYRQPIQSLEPWRRSNRVHSISKSSLNISHDLNQSNSRSCRDVRLLGWSLRVGAGGLYFGMRGANWHLIWQTFAILKKHFRRHTE